ncbi:MAG: hypothetical protein ACUVWX_15100 [Kiritimatiellia bacterium]
MSRRPKRKIPARSTALSLLGLELVTVIAASLYIVMGLCDPDRPLGITRAQAIQIPYDIIAPATLGHTVRAFLVQNSLQSSTSQNGSAS